VVFVVMGVSNVVIPTPSAGPAGGEDGGDS
jgi:hypothetical protein